jgi:RNA polymerase sigma-70 factor (ECF subfamily)
MTDGDAIQRVTGGDVGAFSVLLERHHTSCLRYARRLLGNSETAEEVVQDTFLRAYRGLKSYDHRDQFRSWLFRILINRCRTAAAREKRHTTLIVSGPFVERRYGESPAPERRRQIDAALQELRRDQREAFLLKYVEDLSYEEMSHVTGVSIPALKMRVSRARDELKQILGPRHGNGH